MTRFNSLTFNISGVPGDIAPGTPLWGHPLAGRSGEFSGRSGADEEGWTIGQYFLAARAFISRREVLDRMEGTEDLGDPAGWDVRLELQKHGAFYHPIKLVVSRETAGSGSFVLNGAVSAHGRELARKEGQLLSGVEDRFSFGATPRVIAAGEVERSGEKAAFLMAQWLEGYYEFHRTAAEDAGNAVVVWRPGEDDLYLPLEKVLPAYENIARILTLAYDMPTGAQILFWHHAAGDFILSPEKAGSPVKLITIREYGSMTDDAILDQGPLPGLLFFFVNLCLRMQLDRLDGVGIPVFLGPEVLIATVKGFIRGLEESLGDHGREMAMAVREFLASFDEEQFLMVLEQVLTAWPPSPSEREIIHREIAGFAAQIRALFKSKGFFDFY